MEDQVAALILFLLVVLFFAVGIGWNSGRSDVLKEMLDNDDISLDTYKKYHID